MGAGAVFSGNTAGSFGGAIYSYSNSGVSTVTVGNNAAFSDNSGGSDGSTNGGAIYSTSNAATAAVTVGDNAVFSDNTIGAAGGAISVNGKTESTVTVGDYAFFNGNKAGGSISGQGGAIFAYSPSAGAAVTVGAGAVFTGNSAIGSSGYGGAIFARGAGDSTVPTTVTIAGGSLFEDNEASHSGGAIYISGGTDVQNELNLNTAMDATYFGDIAFTGNKHQTSTPDNFNSVYLASKTNTINLTGHGNIYVNDPLSANTGLGTTVNSLNKDGTGFVQFMGENILNVGDDDGQNVSINAGTFRLAGENASFKSAGANSGAQFILDTGGTLAGSGTLEAGDEMYLFGTVSPDGATFKKPDHLGAGTNPSVSAADRIGTLNLKAKEININQTPKLNIDLAKDGSEIVHDQIFLETDEINFASPITVNLTSFVGGATNKTIMSNTGGGTFADGNFNLVTIGGMTLGGRMAGAAILAVADGNALNLTTTNAVTNERITWKGVEGDAWDFTETNNWKDESDGNISFAANDYVIFTQSTTGLGVDLAYNNALVSGMYLDNTVQNFKDGTITGFKGVYNNSDLTAGEEGFLWVNNGSNANFDNVRLDFESGIKITGNGGGTNSEISFVNGSTVSDNTSILIEGADNKATFDIDDSYFINAEYTYGGEISGAGRLVKTGNSRLTLAGESTDFGGAVFIDQNELRLTNSRAVGDSIITVSAGDGHSTLTLAFNQDSAFNNVVGWDASSNYGSAVVIDGAVVSRTDDTTYSVDTTIKRGGLVLAKEVQRSFTASRVTVDGGYLEVLGTAARSDVTVNSEGTLVAGTGGQIKDLSMAEGSTLKLSLSGAGALKVAEATFDNGVNRKVDLNSGDWEEGLNYEMLTYETLGGAPESAQYLTGRVGTNTVKGQLSWNDDNTLVLNIGATNSLDVYVDGNSSNQRSVARAIDKLDHTGALFGYFDQLDQDYLPKAYFQAGGIGHSTIVGGLQDGSQALGADVLDKAAKRLTGAIVAPASGDGGPESNLWFSFGGQWREVDGQSGQTGKAAWKGPEAALGYDFQTEGGFLVGLAAGLSRQDYEEDGGRHKADLDRLSLALYAGKAVEFGSGRLRFSGGVSFNHYEIDSTRRISLPDMRESLTADYEARAWNVFGEAAYGWAAAPSLWLEPFLGLSYLNLKVDDFHETGGDFALRGRTGDADTFATTLGARGALAVNECLDLTAKLAWEHNFGDRRPDSDFAFDGGGYFRIDGAPLAKDSALIGLGLTQRINERASFTLSYDGALGNDTQRHSGTATLGFNW